MHERIVAGFRHRLLRLLADRPAEERGAETDRLIGQARERVLEGEPLAKALFEIHEAVRAQFAQRRAQLASASALPGDEAERRQEPTPSFVADASLGGLARWLRAAGYEARVTGWRLGEALDEAVRLGLVLLTTDTAVLERRLLADGSLRAVWLPSLLHVRDQLHLVLADLGLPLREPRCMACGGALVPRPKAEVHERIPPRTARWKDEYFVCGSCDRLFWHGTHWERILRVLREAAVPA